MSSIRTVPAEGRDHPYSLVRTVDGRTAWLSGVLPYDPSGSGDVVHDAAPGEVIAAALATLRSRVECAGATLDDVVKTTVFLTDLSWRDALDDAYASTFTPPLPARTAVEVSRLPRDAAIEIDAIVVLRDAAPPPPPPPPPPVSSHEMKTDALAAEFIARSPEPGD
jgi:2-iminobutanoate/2-iminopropanoate deaminase